MEKWVARFGYIGWRECIEKLEVVKETEKQIVYISKKGTEIRVNKETSNDKICNSEQEAFDELEKYQEKQVKRAFDLLQYERKKLRDFKEQYKHLNK